MRLSPAVAVAALTGCFYVAPINQRPSVDIRQLSTGTVHRADMVMLEAVGQDPDGGTVTYTWHISACTDATDANTDCDIPFRNDQNPTVEPIITFQVPAMRTTGQPVKALRVLLEASDDLGAEARPGQELVIPVEDYPATIVLHEASNHHFVVDSHVQLFAEVSDQDDTAAKLDVEWTVETPAPSAPFELTDLQTSGTVDPITYGKELLPHVAGKWVVHVIATDPVGVASEQDFQIEVGDDLPPCITSASPIASPTQELPMFETTLFQVPVVVDDLDVYPPSQSGDVDLGVATFSWSIKQPGASAFTPLAVTSNGVALDPETFSPNDLVELRVEVRDRQPRDFSACLPDDPTCALDGSNPTCFQRETWKVRVQ